MGQDLAWLFSMPNTPIVVVAHFKILGTAPVADGGRGKIGAIRGIGLDDAGQELMKEILKALRHPGGILRGHSIGVLPSPCAPCHIDFIVATKKDDTRVLGHALYLLSRFNRHPMKKEAVARVGGPGKGKVLPDH